MKGTKLLSFLLIGWIILGIGIPSTFAYDWEVWTQNQNLVDAKRHVLIQTAFELKDYEQFKTAVWENKLFESIDTEEKFKKLIELYEARENWDTERIKELTEELWLWEWMKNTKILIKNGKDVMKEKKATLIEENKERKLNIKNNWENFQEEYKEEAKEAFSELSDEDKEKLKELKEKHMEVNKIIKEKLKEKNLTLEERENLKEEIREINNQFTENVKEIVWDNEVVIQFIEKREELRNENNELRSETREARRKYRWEYRELVGKYKQIFLNKLSKILPKLSIEKIGKVSERIEKMILQVEGKENITDEKKEKSLSQLIGLKELMEEELESREEVNENVDLEEIIDEVLED